MDRRLIDLELRGYEEELSRRNGTLDISQADRMRYWLAGWKQAYAMAFETDYSGPPLTDGQCLTRVRSLQAWIAERRQNEDIGTAEMYENWLGAFVACFELATGKPLDDEAEGKAAA